MHLLLTTATATPVLVQKCIKQDPNQFRMTFHLSISSQLYFYCISQQSSLLSRVTVHVTFSHLNKKSCNYFQVRSLSISSLNAFFFVFLIQGFFSVTLNFFLSCSFIELPQKEGNLFYRLIFRESNKSV